MKLIVTALAVLILLALFIRFLEHKSLYYPLRKVELTPDTIGLAYEDVTLRTEDDVQINGWFIPSDLPRATILFAHGNGGNISHRLEKIRILNNVNVNIFIFDYRGYGQSGGSPSEDGFYQDTSAAYDYLINVKKIAEKNIVGYGESLGGAVVINLATQRNVGGLIIESSFTSVSDMGKTILPFIPDFLYKAKFDALATIASVSCPLLILHSPDDEIVPFSMGQKLFKEAQPPKKFVQLQGGHNGAFLVSEPLFAEEINEFLGGID